MEIIVKVALSGDVNDYIISTGKSVYARNLVEKLFLWKGLDYSKHIEERLPVNKKKKNIYISSERLRKNHGISPNLMGLDLFKDIFKDRYFEKKG